jgi:hypothetical protein
MKIIASKNFILNGIKYLKDEEVKVENYLQVVKLNERGFIYPLSYNDLVLIEREFNEKEDK